MQIEFFFPICLRSSACKELLLLLLRPTVKGFKKFDMLCFSCLNR
jgi:hypothetical protein